MSTLGVSSVTTNIVASLPSPTIACDNATLDSPGKWGIVFSRREPSGGPLCGRRLRAAPRIKKATPESIPISAVSAGCVYRPAVEVDCKLIAPDLALDRLHLIVPDGSDAMVVLEAWANGSHPDADPRTVFAERIGEVGHVSVSFGDEDPIQLRLDLPDLVLQCVAQAGPDGTREHLGLRVLSIRPTGGQPEGARSEERRVGKEGR